MTKFGLLTYSTGNVGDDIQSLAARRFLPKVDYYLNRDYLNDVVLPDEEVKVIMNGWYSHRPENFPPKLPQLNPLLLSVYIDNPIKSIFAQDDKRAFFENHGPVGARCIDTQDYFESLGVDTYFSGCLTLTLQAEPEIKKQDFVLALDLPNAAFDKLQRESHLPVIRMSADILHRYMTPEHRLKLAQYYLYLYQSARLVVTTRLHGTLPCLALGTPVLNLEQVGFEPERFAGLRELAHHMTVDEFLAGHYDVNNPLENPTTYLPIREKLMEKCRAFTGYQSEEGFLGGQPLLDFLQDADLIQSAVTGFWSAHQMYGITR